MQVLLRSDKTVLPINENAIQYNTSYTIDHHYDAVLNCAVEIQPCTGTRNKTRMI